MTIKILGSGCPSCLRLEANAKEAVKSLGLDDVKVEHITEIDDIIGYGVMSTPAIVIDEEIKATGHVPNTEEIKSWLT